MLGRLGWWRHGLVAASVAGCGALAGLGVIGAGAKDEHFEAKQIIVQPAGGDAIQVTEVVDIDFGYESRHGYERTIPNDFGVPTDVTASSPDAADDVSVGAFGGETRIRIGDPDTTVSDQHRYILQYTYPDALVSTGQLALDIVDNDETLQTDRFEIVVTGMVLADPLCNIGSEGDSGGCELAQDGDVYRAVISPLEKGQGVTIGGTITGLVDPIDVLVDPAPERRDPATVPLALGIMAVGATGAAGVFALARRKGRNEVFGGGGAADAAFGALPRPGSPMPAAGASTTLVSDDRMASLATIEFVPPSGVAPWQGAVALTERMGDDVVAAWFSGQAASGVLNLDKVDDELRITLGPNRATVDAPTADILDTMFDGRDEVILGKYDKDFTKAWAMVKSLQANTIAESGWWRRMPPTSSGSSGGSLIIIGVIFLVIFGGGSLLTAAVGAIHSVPVALLFGLVVPCVFAWSVYHTLLPSRSGTGSAVALRTESFRRFLAASEGKHVEWAWKQGLLREYSAWAVSLGAATAWSNALAASNVPSSDFSMTGPLLVYSMGPSFNSSHTPPSSSGSGSGSSGGSFGGFSGGSVGGGGGGGSSGSW